jgi:N-carbamoyl-L-amino-acid hydrolase
MIDVVLFRRLFGELAAIGRDDAGWNRLAWGPGEDAARAWFAQAAAALGLVVVDDPAGNRWAHEPGRAHERWMCSGSHVDTVAGGGAYDGALGVVAALVAVEAVRRDSGPGERAALAVGCLEDEEGPRFGTPIFGSRALCGEQPASVLERRDASGAVLADLAAARGVTAGSLAAAPAVRERLAAWLEVHIEQGIALDRVPAALGVATQLAPRERWRARLRGEANHAGTTPMAGRSDALVAAARAVLAADEAARAEQGAVATVGELVVHPGSGNVIPGEVELSLDVRAGDVDILARVRDAVRASVGADGVEVEWTKAAEDRGSVFDPLLREALHAAAREAGVSAVDLAAYAGHDAGVLARSLPAAMLFVRNPTGVSHNPAEHASEEDCLAACEVLARALATLAARSG